MVVGCGLETLVIGQGTTGADERTAVFDVFRYPLMKGLCMVKRCRDAKKTAYRESQSLVEFDKEAWWMLKKGADIIGIIVEKGCLPISTDNGLPVEMRPVAMCADLHLAYWHFATRMGYGDAERQGS